MRISASLMSVKARQSCHCILSFCSAIPMPENVQCLCLKMCVHGGSTVPQGGMGDRHLATVPQGVAGDRVPWGGAGQGGGRGGTPAVQQMGCFMGMNVQSQLVL